MDEYDLCLHDWWQQRRFLNFKWWAPADPFGLKGGTFICSRCGKRKRETSFAEDRRALRKRLDALEAALKDDACAGGLSIGKEESDE